MGSSHHGDGSGPIDSELAERMAKARREDLQRFTEKMTPHIELGKQHDFPEGGGTVGEWIDVNEQLPPNTLNTLLVFVGRAHEDSGITLGCYYDGRWDMDAVGDVTHWMPLPEPPR